MGKWDRKLDFMTVEAMKQDLIKQFVQSRKEQGLTQEQLEERSGVPLSFIIQFESGETGHELDDFMKILHALGLRIVLEPLGVYDGSDD